MALSANTVWETRAGVGSDSSGGGFVAGSGGTDRSQQNAAQVAIDNVTVTTSITTNVITFTGGTYTVLAGDVGNIVQMLTGTNVTAGFYQITSVSAGLNGTWTVDRNIVTSGTTTNATGNMGGALATLITLATAMVGSNKAYCTGTFTQTTTPTFAQNVTSSTSAQTRLIGYGAARGDTGHAVITLSTNTGLTGIKATQNNFAVEQVDVNCSSLGTSIGIDLGLGNGNLARLCKVSNFTSKAFNYGGIESGISDCEATGGTSAASTAVDMTGAGSNATFVTRCNLHDNACTAVKSITGCTILRCLITNNSGASSDGIATYYGVNILNNTIHNNGRHGINIVTVPYPIQNQWLNNILTSNGGYGINNSMTALPAAALYDGNAYFNNSSGTRNGIDSTAGIYGVSPYTNTHDIILTGSPYVGPTTGSTANFGLNNTAGAGAACRAAGVTGTWPGNTGTTGFLDMGAVQHQSTGGGLLVCQGMDGGMDG